LLLSVKISVGTFPPSVGSSAIIRAGDEFGTDVIDLVVADGCVVGKLLKLFAAPVIVGTVVVGGIFMVVAVVFWTHWGTFPLQYPVFSHTLHSSVISPPFSST